ncbi:MAG: hypothetical protein AAF750_16365 [Planctomycetota bacterium]
MPQTADKTQPRTPWLDLLNSPLAGDNTDDLGTRIRRLAEHAVAEHLTAATTPDVQIDHPQPTLSYPSLTGRHGRQPLAQHIPQSPRDHGTAAKECG